MQSFRSLFVSPRKFNFSRESIDILKARAAEFLVGKFKAIHSQPGRACQLPRQPRHKKDLTKWLLPNFFGNQVITNKVLPLGFSSVERSPNPSR